MKPANVANFLKNNSIRVVSYLELDELKEIIKIFKREIKLKGG